MHSDSRPSTSAPPRFNRISPGLFERTVEHWRDFLEVASQLTETNLSPARYPYLARGQAQANWALVPSLLRRLQGRSATEALEVEGAALAKFQENAHRHLPPSVIPAPDDLIPWWILMQHYGAPTRLLDWTASMFVAAYFAVEQYHEHDGVVWLVHVATLDRAATLDPLPPTTGGRTHHITRPDSPPTIYIFGPTRTTDRMAAQQTFFAMSAHILTSHGSAIEATVSAPPDDVERASLEFFRLVIPARLKIEFMARLQAMNLTAEALFPGIDGLGRGITEFVRLMYAHHFPAKG